MFETLDYTIRIGSTPTILYFDLYLYSAYAAHYVYFYNEYIVAWRITTEITELWNRVKNSYRNHAHKRSPNVDNSPSF